VCPAVLAASIRYSWILMLWLWGEGARREVKPPLYKFLICTICSSTAATRMHRHAYSHAGLPSGGGRLSRRPRTHSWQSLSTARFSREKLSRRFACVVLAVDAAERMEAALDCDIWWRTLRATRADVPAF